ncbi:MAG: hypothetical protein OZ948_09215 [Deltaproteobacteria bacterium]|nr:hypothetical protein [Deltaproteobacteria bacterium]
MTGRADPGRRSLLERYRAKRFAWLFFTLLLALALHPIFEAALPRLHPMDWLLGLTLAVAVAGVEQGRHTRALLVLAAGFVAARLLDPLLGDARLHSLSQLCWAAASMIAAALCVRHAFRSRGAGTDAERIFAALDAYLLAGLAFGSLYWVLERELPGSFGPAPLELTPQLAVYVSLATMSTLGPGNVVAMNGPARGLMTFEAVAGQIYLAVLVARLVSLYGQPKGGQAG